jgi:hypothetical protein
LEFLCSPVRRAWHLIWRVAGILLIVQWHWQQIGVFICGLFNDTISSSDCTALNNYWTMNWKEMAVAYFKVISWHSPRGT